MSADIATDPSSSGEDDISSGPTIAWSKNSISPCYICLSINTDTQCRDFLHLHNKRRP